MHRSWRASKHIGSSCPFVIVALVAMTALLVQCTKTEFNNPLDPASPNYAGDSAAEDSDGDGVANLYDPDSPLYYVNDVTPPVLNVSGGDTIIVAQGDPTGVLRGVTVTATDETDGSLIDSVKREGVFFTSKCSTFTILYTVHDGAGNADSVTKILVVDCEAPVIVLAGENPTFVDVGQPFVDLGATAGDNVDGVVTASIVRSGTVVTTAEGVDTLVYTVKDRAGNSASRTRVVKIESGIIPQNHAPTITIVGANPMTLQRGRSYVESGATASDQEDGDLSSAIVVTGRIDSSKVGLDTVVYRVTDKEDVSDTAYRVVRIVDPGQGDTQPPWIELKGSSIMTAKVGDTFVDPGFTSGDSVDGDLTSRVKVTGSVNTTTPGTSVLTYGVSDAAGNPASTTRIVHVAAGAVDKTPPTLTLVGCASCSLDVGNRFVDPGVIAVDSVNGIISSKVARAIKSAAGAVVDSTALSAIGVYTLTYSVSDKAGNAAVPVSRMVHVLDTAGASTDLLKKYGVPASAPLASISKTFTSVTVDGTINIGSIKSLQFQWNLERSIFDYVAFETTDGVPNYHVPLLSAVVQHLTTTGPWITMSNSGFPQLDGEYYVTGDATRLVWVKKDGNGAIVFR